MAGLADARGRYGDNKCEIPRQSFKEAVTKRFMAPFFVFQVPADPRPRKYCSAFQAAAAAAQAHAVCAPARAGYNKKVSCERVQLW